MPGESKRWVTRPVDAGRAARLTQASGLSPAAGQILAGRDAGDPSRVDEFLTPRLKGLTDPFLLPDMTRAVECLWRAIKQGRQIVVYGDYDADGITAAALLTRVLRLLGGNVRPFLPTRFLEGYGLSVEGLERCRQAGPVDVLVTVDCGSCSREAVQAAQSAGIEVVITDHHEFSGDPVDSAPVVNPKREASGALHELAGVGIAFKLCHALVKAGRDGNLFSGEQPDLRHYLDWVAIGTVADVAPLVAENRILVAHGLARLNRAPGVGVRCLMERAGAQSPLDVYHIGFMIAPRLNAAGRLADPVSALNLLLASEATTARALAETLEKANQERRVIEERILGEAVGMADRADAARRRYGVVCAGDGWHVGTIGIVASRLGSRYRRPAVVIAFDGDGMGQGSCRSVEGVNVVEALHECRKHLTGYGGHAMAAGLRLRRGEFEAFCEAFDGVCRDRLAGRDLTPVVAIDAWVEPAQVDTRLLREIQQMAPFGLGNHEPVLGLRGCRLAGPATVIKGKHLRAGFLAGGRPFSAIGFGMGGRKPPEGDVDVAFQLCENSFGGMTSLEWRLQDFRAMETPAIDLRTHAGEGG
jgi:single-stranded-DNA-specific exonuclease